MPVEDIFVMLLWGLVWINIGRWIAKRKGRWTINSLIWLFLVGPIAIVFLLFAKRDQDALDDALIEEGKRIRCPDCANIIRTEAIVCSFCGKDMKKPEQEGDHVGEKKQESDS